jgi:hypothetical protein
MSTQPPSTPSLNASGVDPNVQLQDLRLLETYALVWLPRSPLQAGRTMHCTDNTAVAHLRFLATSVRRAEISRSQSRRFSSCETDTLSLSACWLGAPDSGRTSSSTSWRRAQRRPGPSTICSLFDCGWRGPCSALRLSSSSSQQACIIALLLNPAVSSIASTHRSHTSTSLMPKTALSSSASTLYHSISLCASRCVSAHRGDYMQCSAPACKVYPALLAWYA